MVSRPTTPDSTATSLGNVSGEDEFPPEVKGTFEIRLASGRTMICHFDGDTSAAGALRQALENQDFRAFRPDSAIQAAEADRGPASLILLKALEN